MAMQQRPWMGDLGQMPPAIPFSQFPAASSVPGQRLRAIDRDNATYEARGNQWWPVDATGDGLGHEHPMTRRAGQWERLTQTPIIADSPNALWPWIVRVDTILPSPLGKYYLYASTDHDPGAGGIYMWWADALEGPWTSVGLVFQDLLRTTSVGHPETETPSVVHDPDVGANGGLRMFYQQIAATYTNAVGTTTNAEGIQSTLSCTSEDGLTWTVDPTFIIDVRRREYQPGNGHCGYFVPFEIDGQIAAYSLYSSGIYPHHALHVCLGNLHEWATDQRLLGYTPDKALLPDGVSRLIAWNHSFACRIKGKTWLIGMADNYSAGSDPKNSRIAMWPLSDDCRVPLSVGKMIWEPQLPWETGNMRAVTPYIEDGVVHVVYMCITGGLHQVGIIRHA